MTVGVNEDVDRALSAFGGAGFKYRTFGTFSIRPKVQVVTKREDPVLANAVPAFPVIPPAPVAHPPVVEHAGIEQVAAAYFPPPVAPIPVVAMQTARAEAPAVVPPAVVPPAVVAASAPIFVVTVPLSPAEVADAEEEAVAEMAAVTAEIAPQPLEVFVVPPIAPLPARPLVREPAYRSSALPPRPQFPPARPAVAADVPVPATSRFKVAEVEPAGGPESPVFQIDWDRRAGGRDSAGRPIGRVAEPASDKEPGLFRRL